MTIFWKKAWAIVQGNFHKLAHFITPWNQLKISRILLRYYILHYALYSVQQSCTLMMNVISSLLTTSSVATPLLSPVHSVSTPLLSSSIHSLEETSSDFNTQFLIGSTCNDVLLKAQVSKLTLIFIILKIF